MRLLAELPLSLNFTFTSAGTAVQGYVGSWRLPRSAVSAAATWPGLPHTQGTNPSTASLLAFCSGGTIQCKLVQPQVKEVGEVSRWLREALREAG